MNSYRGGGGGQRRGSGRRGSRQPSNLNSLPFEQGIICSLKESFGFIHCAERPEEVFFHYSEVMNCHPNDLQIDTEVEFRIASNNDGKNAAYSVHRLDPGTVVWEVEEAEGAFYQGLVEKPCMPPRGGGNGPQMDGSIRIVEPRDNNNNNNNNNPSGEFKEEESDNNDNNDNNNKPNNNNKKQKNGPLVRLRAGEYTGARMESNSRDSSSRLFRGDLVQFRVFLDNRTKQKYAREITLLQSDRERKRIEKEKKLLENAALEEGIVVSLNNGFGFIKSNKRREDVYFHYSQLIIPEPEEGEDDDFELKKGQEVKFLVVTEPGSNKSNGKISARQIECLPKGSVIFRTVEVKGVKGIVVRVPHPPSPGSKNDDSKWGRVRLLDQPQDGKDSKALNDILFHYSDAPGGVFTYQNHRNQPMSALWIHEGDTIIFDVAKETVDGSLRVIPTLHKIGLGGSVISPDGSSEEPPVVRLIGLSMIGRAEGVIHTLKSDYGFIHFAERSIDVHFKTYDFMPDELQADIRLNMGIEEQCILEEEAAVRFDICAHGNITTTTQRGRRRGAQQARENIRGQRIILLPKSAVSLEKSILTCVKGVVKSVNPKELYSGVVELEEEAKQMTMDERHPIVAKMISSFLEESSLPNGRKSIVFRDTLGMSDGDVIIEMARIKGQGVLECSHIPVPGIAPHPGRICIRRVKKEENADGVETEAETKEDSPKEVPRKGKKKGKENQPVKSLRFDKSSLEQALKDDIPPSTGDLITCDVVQSRRSGKISIRNLKITERNTVPVEIGGDSTESGLGVVKDVVGRRHFGFISVYDENNSKTEMLFFHLPKDKRFVKGSEVKFDIAMEGSKRIAINVECVRKGTIPSAASKNACLGYILMEPSHTTLSNTPVRKTAKAKVGNGRWADGNDDAKTASKQDMVEDGCILLLEDKTGMFQKRHTRRRKKRSGSVDSADSTGDLSLDGAKSVGSDDGLSSDDGMTSGDEDNGIVSVLSRLNYKNGSIAIHGAGVTSSMDGSTNPKRGDLVSFIKGRKARTARDIRIVKREEALLQRGRLENITVIDTEDQKNKGKAQFIAATENQEVYDIDLAEVVSCSASILKEKESMEGILHEGKVYGICRTSDLYLKSKLFGGSGKNRERPKLNLTVKRNRGGTIMAQSMMAKGPDGTIGFKAGWTNRVSLYAIEEPEPEAKEEDQEVNEADAGSEQPMEVVTEGGN